MMQTQLQPRLTRSSHDRMLAGVAGGLARYFEVDSTLMRIAMVALFFAGVGLVLYPVLWLCMPREDQAAVGVQPGPGARFHPLTGQVLSADQEQPALGPRSLSERQRLFGLVLVGLGAYVLGGMLFPWAADVVFPALLIAAGVVLISRSRQR